MGTLRDEYMWNVGYVMIRRTTAALELEQYRVDVLTEQERRQRLSAIPTQVTQLAGQFVADGGDKTTLIDALS